MIVNVEKRVHVYPSIGADMSISVVSLIFEFRRTDSIKAIDKTISLYLQAYLSWDPMCFRLVQNKVWVNSALYNIQCPVMLAQSVRVGMPTIYWKRVSLNTTKMSFKISKISIITCAFCLHHISILKYRIPQVVKVELPSASNWCAFIYFFVIGISSMFTEMIIKI